MTTKMRKPEKDFLIYFETPGQFPYGMTKLQAGSVAKAKKKVAAPGREIVRIYENGYLVWERKQ